MKFGYYIIYVPSVPDAIDFYERAFGLKTLMIHESKQYGEMDTGETKLAFADETLGSYLDIVPGKLENKPHGVEIAFVTEDVRNSYNSAIKAGAIVASEPKEMPWGQTVSYVRDLNGFLVKICSPVNKNT